jgi:hypothetical protein
MILLLTAFLQAGLPAGEFVPDASRSDDIAAVINRSTSDLNFIKRPIARKRLKGTNPPPQTISIRSVGDSIDVVVNGNVVLRTKPGTQRKWRYNDEDLDVTTTLDNGVLTNTFKAGDGLKRNTYRMIDADDLELTVHISSPQLKHDVDYKQILTRVK